MQRKFLLNLILLVFLNLLVKPFYILGIDTEFIERLGQEVYGNYFALLNLSILLNIFLDFGIVNFNTGNIARHQQLVGKYFKNVMGLRFLLAIIYLLFTLVAALFLGYTSEHLGLLTILCFNQVLAGFILYFRSNLAGLHLFAQDSILSVLDRIILIILCSLVLWTSLFQLEVSIELFVYLQTLAYGLGALAGFLLTFRKAGSALIVFNMPFSYLILKKSFPYALLFLLMGFYYRTDGVMLERMLDRGAYEAGIYAQGFRFFEAGNMMAYLFAALLFPMFSKMIQDKKDVKDLLTMSFKIITTGTVLGGLIGFFYAEEIMDLRYSSEIASSAAAFKYLMLGFTGICGTYIFGALLTANQNLKSLNIMAVTGVVMNVLLNLLLIPMYRAEGAAIASMITQLSMAIYQIVLVRRKLKTGISTMIWMKLLLFIIGLLCLFFTFGQTDLNWMGEVMMVIVGGMILGYILKLYSPGAIIKMIKMQKNLN
jgi:O-antigen/teichoic acid export membrane protein